MHRPVEPLIHAETIARRVAEIGRDVTREAAGRPLLVVGVLTGAAVFVADLIRAIEGPLAVDFVAVSSYGDSERSSGEVRLLKDLTATVSGRRVLLVEDIVDTGQTLQFLLELLSARSPESLDVCALLDKPSRRLVDVSVRHRGFEIEDRFVVGYGLDASGLYRNLPHIGVLEP